MKLEIEICFIQTLHFRAWNPKCLFIGRRKQLLNSSKGFQIARLSDCLLNQSIQLAHNNNILAKRKHTH